MRLISRFLIVMCLMAANPASAGKRIALVIGNSAYRHAVGLPNPAPDAAAMGQLFRDAHFDVVDVKSNLDAAAFKAALRDFTTAASDVDIAVIYFAGHGVEVGGVNYLVPVDAQLSRDIDVEDEAISLDRVQRSMEKARQLRLVILDACRENPFSAGMARTGTTRSVARGLARIKDDDDGISLVAFAAKAGSTAADGDTGHSPYTAALLANLTTPGLDIRFALGKVHDAVVKATRGSGTAQVPAVYGSYGGDALALVPGTPVAAAAPLQPPPATEPPPVAQPSSSQREQETAAVTPSPLPIEPAPLPPPAPEITADPPPTRAPEPRYADLPPDLPPDPPRPRYSFPTNTEPDGWAALKAGPSLRAARLAKVYDGTRFVVTGYQSGWAHVRLLTGQSGWIIGRLVGCCTQ